MDASGVGGRPIAGNSEVALSNNKVDIGGKKAVDFQVGRTLAEKAVVAAIAAA